MPKNIHDGHRGRMRERFLETGLEGYQPHEILEMLLYYPIARKDTNPIAHRLLTRFGTLQNVLGAEPDALRQVEGMTENAVVFLTLLRSVFEHNLHEQYIGREMNTFETVGRYFTERYKFEQNEVVCAALLDDRLRLMRCETVSSGHPSASEVSVRRLTELAIKAGCNVMILAHNHPNGKAVPSDADIAVTRHLVKALAPAGIQLVDHIVVGDDKAVSLREYGGLIGL